MEQETLVGTEVCVTVLDDSIEVRPASGGDVLDEVEQVYLDSPVFSDDKNAFGVVVDEGESAMDRWEAVKSMPDNEVYAAVPRDGAGFEIAKVQDDSNAYSVGDVVKWGEVAILNTNGVGVVFDE